MNLLEVALAAIQASVPTAFIGIFGVFLFDLARWEKAAFVPGGVLSPHSLFRTFLGGVYLTCLLVCLAAKSGHVPRTELSSSDRNLCIVCGFIAGFVGTPLGYYALMR